MGDRLRAKNKRSAEFCDESGSRGFFGKPTLVVFWLFVLAACLAVAIPAFPQYEILRNIETELADVEGEELRMRMESRQLAAEVEAVKKNPRYLEARARDPLRYQIEGETIIQIED